MRAALLLPALAGALFAGPKGIDCAPDHGTALETARTRGKMLFLTVLVDHDAENRAVVEEVLADRALQKTLQEFVCVYANPEQQHGQVAVKTPAGKRTARCADFPSIECRHHILLAQSWARGFFGDNPVKTPIHFVIDEKEEVLDTLFVGDFQTGFNRVPAKTIQGRLEALLKKRGRGLSEEQYSKMVEDLRDAKAARVRENVTLELKHLLSVAALERDVEGVREAKGRIREIDAVAAKHLEAARAVAASARWEEAIAALRKIEETYAGAPSALVADQEEKALRARDEVKRLLAAREAYEKGVALQEANNPDGARRKFEECIRRGPGTKYEELARKALDALPPAPGK